MLLLLASKEQRSNSITARSMCGVHAAPRSMCGVAGCGIYTRRASAAGDLHIVKHSEQTVNHNTTLPRKVDKTRQKYKHESALFLRYFGRGALCYMMKSGGAGRTVRRPLGWWAQKQTVNVRSICRFFGS